MNISKEDQATLENLEFRLERAEGKLAATGAALYEDRVSRLKDAIRTVKMEVVLEDQENTPVQKSVSYFQSLWLSRGEAQ